jgi:hypothetical protein
MASSSIDDYSKPNPELAKMMKQDGVAAGPLGFRALLDRGLGADHPPADFHNALAKNIQETVAFWCEQFVAAGLPSEKLYPHVAAPAPIEVMNAPIWTAFNKYSRPGWTTYPVDVLGESFRPIAPRTPGRWANSWKVHSRSQTPESSTSWRHLWTERLRCWPRPKRCPDDIVEHRWTAGIRAVY